MAKQFTQEELDAAIAKEVTGLKSANADLLSDLSDLKKAFAPFKGLDAAEIKAALKTAKQAEEDKLKAEGEYEKLLEQATKQHEKDRAKWEADRDEWAKDRDKSIKGRAVREALKEAKIADPYVETMTPFLESKIAIVGDGDKRAAMIGEKTPAEFLVEYAGTDAGKHYVAAAGNTGGGAGGSGDPGTGDKNPFSAKHFDMTKQMAIQKADPAKAERLKKTASAERDKAA